MYCTLSCPSDIIVFIMVFACVAGSWGVHHGLKPKLRKRVKTALVNSYSCRDMLSTCSLVESCLVSDAYAMEDVVIGALSKKCSRPNVPKGGGSKEVPLENGSILQSELPLSRNCHLLLQRLVKLMGLQAALVPLLSLPQQDQNIDCQKTD